MINDLNERYVTFKFTKADGSERTMTATRNLNLIPSEFHPTSNGSPTLSDTIRVYEKDIGWRSFKPSTVINHD
jgi:hypothetical protein